MWEFLMASILISSLKAMPSLGLRSAVILLSTLFLVGVAILAFLPETKGRPLPE